MIKWSLGAPLEWDKVMFWHMDYSNWDKDMYW